MPISEGVVISWLKEPADPVSRSGPIHEIQRKFSSERVSCCAGLPRVDPFGADADHQLCLFRQHPRFLKTADLYPIRLYEVRKLA